MFSNPQKMADKCPRNANVTNGSTEKNWAYVTAHKKMPISIGHRK